MRTTTRPRSRARAALAGLVALLAVALVSAAVVFAVLGVWPNLQGGMHRYQSYQLEISPTSPWHPGQSLSLQWVPMDAGTTQPVPRSETCSFSLYGAYATQAAAQADSPSVYTLADVAPAASAPSLQLSSDPASPAPMPVTYALPATLTPGYYIAVGDAEDAGGGGGSSSWVVEVSA